MLGAKRVGGVKEGLGGRGLGRISCWWVSLVTLLVCWCDYSVKIGVQSEILDLVLMTLS